MVKKQRDLCFESEEEGKEGREIRAFTRARILIWLLECKCREECRNRGWEIAVQPGESKCRVTVTSGPIGNEGASPTSEIYHCRAAGGLEKTLQVPGSRLAENRCRWLICLPSALSFKGTSYVPRVFPMYLRIREAFGPINLSMV